MTEQLTCEALQFVHASALRSTFVPMRRQWKKGSQHTRLIDKTWTEFINAEYINQFRDISRDILQTDIEKRTRRCSWSKLISLWSHSAKQSAALD